MMLRKLSEFLDSNGVKYSIVSHATSYTADEVARSAHITGKELAKTVVVWMDGAMALVVLPGSHLIDFTLLRTQSSVNNVELANESEFRGRFPECEIGAMPPFGNLFAMRTFVATVLREDREIVFNAGNHRDLVKMAYADFERLVRPTVLSFTFRKSVHEEDIPSATSKP